MSTKIKVCHLQDDTYQVIEFVYDEDIGCNYEECDVLHQGSISDCEAYVRLKDSDLLA